MRNNSKRWLRLSVSLRSAMAEECNGMSSGDTDFVKEQVAAHWGRRASGFDDGFGHSIRTPAERAAWDRIFNLVLTGRGSLDALDAGCGTGFLSFGLAARR